MKMLLAIILFTHSIIAFAMNEIWLQDTDCMVMRSNGFDVQSKHGTLITYICTKNSTLITCSNTSKNDLMHENKPSVITNYIVIIKDKDIAVWKASSHEGIIILDLKNKRYSVTSTHILDEGLFNKNCVGAIKNY